MLLSLLVAASENNVIGKDNALPWHLPDDLKRFKALTRGKTVIMGRKTYESIGHPLPDRRNIVISRQLESAPEGTELAHSINDAVDLVKSEAEVFVIGGADIYAQLLPLGKKIYMTRVHATIEGDAFFPEINLKEWKEISNEEHSKDEKHAFSFSFIDYERT